MSAILLARARREKQDQEKRASLRPVKLISGLMVITALASMLVFYLFSKQESTTPTLKNRVTSSPVVAPEKTTIVESSDAIRQVEKINVANSINGKTENQKKQVNKKEWPAENKQQSIRKIDNSKKKAEIPTIKNNKQVINTSTAVPKVKKRNEGKRRQGQVVSVNKSYLNYKKIMQKAKIGPLEVALSEGRKILTKEYLRLFIDELIQLERGLDHSNNIDMIYEVALSSFPKDEDYSIDYVRHLLSTKREQEALAFIGAKIKQGLVSESMQQFHALVLVKNEKYREASLVYRHLLSRQPNHPRWLLGLALCQEQVGNTLGAIQIYRNLMRQNLDQGIKKSAIADKLVLLERQL